MNKKKVVCHFVSGLKSGGVESMIYNYCRNFDRTKFKFILVYQHEPSEKNVKEFKDIEFELIQIPSKIKHPIKNYFMSKKILKNNKVDVVHCHMTLMNFIPLIAAKKAGVKVRICHSHNSDVRKKNIIIKILENILKKMCIRNSTYLVACGKDAGVYMYGENTKYEIINNALDLNKYMFSIEKRNQIRKRFNISDDTFVIGHVGRFTEQKNHDFLIKVFQNILLRNKNVALFLIGNGELYENIKEKCEKLNIENYVNFIGVVDNVSDYYSVFDIFVLPSIWEGLPVVSIEAQLSGIKCFFSNKIDKNAVIYNKNAKLIRLDLEEWVRNLEEIIKKSNKYDRTIDTKLFCDSGYDINAEIKKLKKIYTGGSNEED